MLRLQSVSPWEIERDPEEEALREAQRRKEEEAAARAARAARAKSRRCMDALQRLADPLLWRHL